MNVCLNKDNNDMIFKETLANQICSKTNEFIINKNTRNDGGTTEEDKTVYMNQSTRYGNEYIIPIAIIHVFNTDTDKPYLYLDFVNKEDGTLFKRFEFHATNFNWKETKAKSGTVLKDLYELYSELVQLIKDNKDSSDGYMNILDFIENTYINYDIRCN